MCQKHHSGNVLYKYQEYHHSMNIEVFGQHIPLDFLHMGSSNIICLFPNGIQLEGSISKRWRCEHLRLRNIYCFGLVALQAIERDPRHLVYLLVPGTSSPVTFDPTGVLSVISCPAPVCLAPSAVRDSSTNVLSRVAMCNDSSADVCHKYS